MRRASKSVFLSTLLLGVALADAADGQAIKPAFGSQADAALAAVRALVSAIEAGDTARVSTLLTSQAVLVVRGGPERTGAQAILSGRGTLGFHARESLVVRADATIRGHARCARWTVDERPQAKEAIEFLLIRSADGNWRVTGIRCGAPP